MSMTQGLIDKNGFDAKLGLLPHIAQVFGTAAVEAIILGLSRPFRSTSSEAAILIDQWERRDTTCCYSGSVQDLFALKDTCIISISYKHSPREQWSRKGSNRICKFSEEDELLFKAAVKGIGKNPHYLYLIVWCDQVVSTRLKNLESGFKWFHIGLLPYMTFQVLQLSTNIPEETLERRIWIRAERSLGRKSQGCLSADDAAMRVIGSLGAGGNCRWCITDLSKNILSGYWPEDLGHWANDYKDLKQWALGVLCRGCNDIFTIDLFQDHDPVDNVEILLNLDELSIIPTSLEKEEPLLFTPDRSFFLKAIAWNVSVQAVWTEEPPYLSHYMGRMRNTRFSWWRCNLSNMVFGCLACYAPPSATTVLAIEKSDGYDIFRSKGNLALYRHAERCARTDTRRLIRESGRKAGIDIEENLDWRLLYCSDDDDINSQTPREIMNVLGERKTRSDVLIPSVFRGMTRKLYMSAVAVAGGQEEEIAGKICKYAEEWSEFVKRQFPEWISVKDTTCGPVWLEGFDEKRISFGFLEFLTEALVLRKHHMSNNTCGVPKPERVLEEFQSVTAQLKVEERMLAEELFAGDRVSLTRKDAVRFMFCGGFSKSFLPNGAWNFIARVAQARGYWTTIVICLGGKMQIRFTNVEEIRIAQRSTELGDCSGTGFVRPADHDAVISISGGCNMGASQGMFAFWKDMDDTTTRADMVHGFQKSMWNRDGKEILLVDMTIGNEIDEDSVLEVQNVEKMFDVLREVQGGSEQQRFQRRGVEQAKWEKRSNATDAWIREVTEKCRQAARETHELRVRLGMEDSSDAEEVGMQ